MCSQQSGTYWRSGVARWYGANEMLLAVGSINSAKIFVVRARNQLWPPSVVRLRDIRIL